MYQELAVKIIFWKLKLESYKNNADGATPEYIELINDLINNMHTAIRNMNDAANVGYHGDQNDLTNYNLNFGVVSAFILSLDPSIQIHQDTPPPSIHDAIDYMDTTSMEINPTMNDASDFLETHSGLLEEYETELANLLTQFVGYQDLLHTLEKSPSKPAVPADPFRKHEYDTDTDDSDDEGIYYTINNTSAFFKDPLAEVQDNLIIPGLESKIDFSFFGSLVTV